MCLSFAGVAGPTGGVHPLGAVAGGVDVDADEDDVGFAEGGAMGVDAVDAFFEGDVFGFGDKELGVVAFGLKGCEDLVGEVAGVGVFEEGAVWGAFAGGVEAVPGSRRMSIKKGNWWLADSLGFRRKARVSRRAGVIDGRVLSLTLKRLRRLLTIRLRSEEDECRLYTINAWHCQAHIS